MYYISNLSKEPEDLRDYQYDIPKTLVATTLPIKVDHRPLAGGIENQARTNSCTANATVSCLEILLTKVNAFVDLSRLFLYYNIREPYDNLKEVDEGAYIRDTFKSVSKLGICTEAIWPFDAEQVNVKPSDEAYDDAETKLCTRYERVVGYGLGDLNNAAKIKYVLAKGYPVLVSLKLGRTFYSINGTLDTHNYPGVQNDLIGGHAMCVVGYDDNLNSFIVENSWGSDWGDNGYCAIDYQVLVNDLQDSWVCTEFAGYKFEDDFVLNVETLTTENVDNIFYFNDDVRDCNLFCKAEAHGGTPPYTYEFKDPMGAVYQEESNNPFFRLSFNVREAITSTFKKHTVCVIRDSGEPYQQIFQKFITECIPGTMPKFKTAKAVVQLYVALFNKVPDTEGFDYWMYNNMSYVIELANAFHNIGLGLEDYPHDNEGFIRLLYKNVLNKEPDDEGLAYWVSTLEDGHDSPGAIIQYFLYDINGVYKVLFDTRVFVAQQYLAANKSYDLDNVTEEVESYKAALSLL